MSLRLHDVTEADLPAVLSLRNRAFGPLPSGDGDSWWQRVAEETLGGRWLAVADDGELVGAGRIRPYSQAWGGQQLQMGGVAGVCVEPSARGRGVASTLTQGLIARMGELGDVVSCLFPTTVSLYRRSGYEVGGVQQRTTYAGSTLRELASMGRAGTGRARAPARGLERGRGDARAARVRRTQRPSTGSWSRTPCGTASVARCRVASRRCDK